MTYREAHAKVAAYVQAWRRKAYPFAQAETVECPACAGQLRLVQSNQYAAANWVSVQCATPFCVNYTE